MQNIDQETPSGLTNEPASPNFWVGLGASAGGLEALTHCVAHLPLKSGCVYIIAQHMSPNHRSLMAEILGREAELPVCEATSNVAPQPDHIYIVPPGQNLTLRDGRFLLVATTPEISPKPSINLLFQSLAENFGEHAIGIVLSGTGADGTSGLRAIKAAGGIGIAQNPASAKYEGMPQAAIDAGVVDRVLDPSEIGSELDRIIQFSGALPTLDTWEERPPDLARIFEMVTERTRIDFSGYKISTVLRRLQRRFATTDCFNPPEYVSYCERHPEELDALARETLISVTEFFRDREAFHALGTRITDLVATKQEGEECRVWVVGCATGEEVYSIAILFAEALGPRLSKRILQIFATDIDEIALAVARRAVYPLAALTEMSPELAARYFTPVDGGMQVARPLRECITFARQNLVADPPFLRLDIVTCRNVLIYFNTELQARALATLHFGLREEGTLFLGRSENANHQAELFTPLDRRNRLFKRRNTERRVDITQVIRGTLAKGGTRSPHKAALPIEREFLEAVGQCYAMRTMLIDHGFNILYSRGEITPFIDLPQGSPQMNLAQIITPEFRGELATTLNRARRSNKAAKSRRKKLARARGTTWQMTVHPIPHHEGVAEKFLVVFDQVLAQKEIDGSEPADSNELAATREHLQALIEEMAATSEEMQALNEEVQAANEELQAANEELEAANEELQASNEELVAVNDESMVKSSELAAVNADFESVYNTLDFPVIVFDADLFVKRVNTSASRHFDLPAGISGQHLTRLRLPEHFADLSQRMAKSVHQQQKEIYAINHGDTHWQVYITPTLSIAGDAQSVVFVVIDHSQLAQVEARLQQSREDLLAIMTHSPSLVSLKDTAGRYHFANPRWCAVFGLDAEIINGKTDSQLLPAAIARLLRECDLAVMGHLGSHEALIELTTASGKHFLQATSFPIFAADGTVNFICTQAIDVTRKQKAEEQLRLAAAVFKGAGEAIMVSNASGQIIAVNPAFTRITGYSPEEAIGQTPRLLKSGRHEKLFYDSLWRSLSQSGFWQGEIFNKRKNGDTYPEWLTINAVPSDDGKVHNFVAMFSDISAIKTTQQRIEFMATHDELTGLPNRTLLTDRIKHGITQAARKNHKLALLFIDLDNFKNINDSLGHDVGDLLLMEASHRLKTCVRDADTLARLGGDEFVALLVDVDIEQIRHIASRVVDFTSASFSIRERNLFVSASIGIAIYPDDGEDSSGLLKNADTAMYRAKERGKNQYQFFADEMKVIALQRMTIESGLRLALDAGYFTVVYQPKIDLSSQRLVGAEALLRWDDPSLGTVSPTQFIPIAERCGLINAVGDATIKIVLDQMRRWQDDGLALCPVSINVSSQQLRNTEFASHLAAQIRNSGVPASLLCLEITESTLMQDIDTSRQMLEQLTRIGLSISIDDFGTGYSSLSYLKRLPLSELKVDKSFVDNVDTDPDDRTITTAIIDLAHALGLRVVAEGVERASHANALIELGCEFAQGNYFHYPLLPGQLATLMGCNDRANA
ncbi:MAG: PAS domain S-box protein [Betaproteobacteria bacterium HGW-Betaproteobacteria-10]|nr:MAG: PAS domain S-box protein [Betaproteobacteria bacterium HGW-Betaproteobacteria-10]